MMSVQNLSWSILDPGLLIVAIVTTIFVECFIVWLYWRRTEVIEILDIILIVICANLITGVLGFVLGVLGSL